MIAGLENTPPLIAWGLGFFMALALKRGRIAAIIDRLVPTGED
jgi:hypothetical protein